MVRVVEEQRVIQNFIRNQCKRNCLLLEPSSDDDDGEDGEIREIGVAFEDKTGKRQLDEGGSLIGVNQSLTNCESMVGETREEAAHVILIKMTEMSGR